MQKKRILQLISLQLISLLLLSLSLAYPVLARPPAQGPSLAWIIWEMEQPPQSLQLNGPTLWVGSYKGGLYQWDIEQGYQNHYTTTHGLAGDDIVGLALDGSGNVLAAAIDGGLVVGNPPFTDLTPPDDQRAWDLAVDNGGKIWLASLGGGVGRYSGGTWIVYNTTNTSLPTNDIYAIATDGSTPWIGTVGYGLAALNGSNWVTYTLPVNIAHPITPTILISNNAVVDIAIDTASVALEFEYALAGESRTYSVKREWKTKASRFKEDLLVLENGKILSDTAADQWQDFLQDLIPPGLSQLFFFDGEKIQAIAEDGPNNWALAKARVFHNSFLM